MNRRTVKISPKKFGIAALCAFAIMGAACLQPNSDDKGSSSEALQAANIELIRSFVREVVNGGNIEAIPEYWHEDMVWRGGSLGEYHGIEAYMDLVRATAGKAFTDMYLEIDAIHAIGDDLVVDRFTNSGNNTGSFMGFEPTNKFAKWDGMAFYKIKDGKISEAWFAEDILSIYFQLGFLKQ